MKRGLTLAVAESCTGGLVGDRVTDVPRSSRYFVGGVIAYSNAAKMSLLGVSRQTLAKWGAVSEQSVREMAAGVCRRFGAQVGVAVSGIAGPGGGSRIKPVGLVYTCVKVGRRHAVERHRFRGGRRAVKEQSAAAALQLCRRVLEGEV
jgi:PncC family amidohydrolase